MDFVNRIKLKEKDVIVKKWSVFWLYVIVILFNECLRIVVICLLEMLKVSVLFTNSSGWISYKSNISLWFLANLMGLCDDCYFVIINSDICVYVIEYSLNLTKGFLCDTSVLDWMLEDERV